MNSEPFSVSNDILNDGPALQRRMRADGYLFIRGLLPVEPVMALRRQMLSLCAEAGWLRPGTDLMDGLTDHDPIAETDERVLPVYGKVQQLESFHRLKLHENIRTLMERLFDEPVYALPNTVGRIAFPRDNERITQPHQDWLYIQGSTETISAWAPLGDVPEEVGGLKVLRGSHKAGILFPRKAEGPGGHTVDVDPTLSWACGPFKAGDVLMFNSLTIHGARPNNTPDRIRLSMDFRYVGVSHTTSQSNLPPHFHWNGEPFTWDTLSRGWTDASLKRYLEKPPLKTAPHEHRIYQKN